MDAQSSLGVSIPLTTTGAAQLRAAIVERVQVAMAEVFGITDIFAEDMLILGGPSEPACLS